MDHFMRLDALFHLADYSLLLTKIEITAEVEKFTASFQPLLRAQFFCYEIANLGNGA
jgi:hypothetical protein